MLIEQKDVFYYVTLMNENYAQPDLPESVHDQLIKGGYLFAAAPSGLVPHAPKVSLLGSGAILCEVVKAAALLEEQGIAAEVFSITSWSELARDGLRAEQSAMAGDLTPTAYVKTLLSEHQDPVIAATDYVRAVPESIRAYLPQNRRYITLGTDGFGRSDTRQELRSFFQVDAASIVRVAVFALGKEVKKVA